MLVATNSPIMARTHLAFPSLVGDNPQAVRAGHVLQPQQAIAGSLPLIQL